MVAASKGLGPLLEIGALSDAGLLVASCGFELDEDSLEDGRAWWRSVVGVDPLLVPSSIP